MSSAKASHLLNFPLENQILSALPKEEYGRLLPDLTRVHLPPGRVLWNAGDSIRYAFFPLSGMLSLLSVTEAGASVEVGMIGHEGLAGISAVLRFARAYYPVITQLPTSAQRIKVEALMREFDRGGRLQDLLLRYAHGLLRQVSQSALCNRFHTTEERLCRWLLISRDRARADTIHLTQEFLAQMIGVPRPSVTVIASRIQRMGLISYSRGRIRILDPRGLEAFSCECYRVISEECGWHTAA